MKRISGALCVGNAVVDVVVGGYTRAPKMGTVGLVGEVGLFPGGNPVNTSIDLARMGCHAAIVAPLGRDGLGNFLMDRLRQEGVDTRNIIYPRNAPTGSTVVLVEKGGERGFMHAPGANQWISDGDIPGRILKMHRWLHLCGYFLLPSLDGAPSERLLRRASGLGLETSLDVCWDPSGKWGRVLKTLRHVDWFLPSMGEAEKIFGMTDPGRVAKAALRAGVRRGIVLKMGSAGSRIYLSNGEEAAISPVKVRQVDATGAGDAFNAGFIAARLGGAEPLEAARAGSAAGALAVSGMGGGGKIRSWAQVKALARRAGVATAFNRRVE